MVSFHQAEHPELSFGMVTKLLGKQWMELSEEGRQPYRDLSHQDKIRYERDMREYRQRLDAAAAAAGNSGPKRQKRAGGYPVRTAPVRRRTRPLSHASRRSRVVKVPRGAGVRAALQRCS